MFKNHCVLSIIGIFPISLLGVFKRERRSQTDAAAILYCHRWGDPDGVPRWTAAELLPLAWFSSLFEQRAEHFWDEGIPQRYLKSPCGGAACRMVINALFTYTCCCLQSWRCSSHSKIAKKALFAQVRKTTSPIFLFSCCIFSFYRKINWDYFDFLHKWGLLINYPVSENSATP